MCFGLCTKPCEHAPPERVLNASILGPCETRPHGRSSRAYNRLVFNTWRFEENVGAKTVCHGRGEKLIRKSHMETGGWNPTRRREALAALPPLSWGWVLMVVTAVVYGSLIPFDTASALAWRSILSSVQGLRFVAAPFSDRLLNILIFVPVGFLFVLCRPARHRITRGAISAVLSGVVISIAIEATQTLLVSRVGSWYDVILNVTGVAMGAWVAILARICGPRLVGLASHRLETRLFGTLAAVVSLGLLVYDLFPFDFVRSTQEMFTAFRTARWDLTSVRLAPVGTPPFEALVAQLTGAGWFALLGYLSALANREQGRRAGVSLGSAIKQGVLLACLIEGMQLFCNSHVFDLASIVLRSVGTVLGAWAAIFVVDELSRRRWRNRPDAAAPGLLLATILAFQLTLLALTSLGFGSSSLANITTGGIAWMPFRSLWEQTPYRAVTSAISICSWYGSVSLVLMLLLRRTHMRRSWVLAIAAVFLLAVAMEIVKAASTTRTADSTDVILAVIAAVVARWLVATLVRLKRLSQ